MDFALESRSLVKPEFQAVIIAGFGQRLDPLTDDHGKEPCPKALLPIANKTMISYPLTWLESSGVKDVMIICALSHRAAISHHIQSDSTFVSLQLDIQTFDDSEAEPRGACDVLRKFADRIQSDFVLLACDFIAPPALPLSLLLNTVRLDTSGMLLISLFYEPGTESRRPNDEKPPVIVYDERTGTLLHINTDDGEDDINVSMRILNRYPAPRISNRLTDSHVYVCRRTILDVLPDRKHFHSIRHDLIPWLCKIQYQNSKREVWESVLHPPKITPSVKPSSDDVPVDSDLATRYSSAHLLIPPKAKPLIPDGDTQKSGQATPNTLNAMFSKRQAATDRDSDTSDDNDGTETETEGDFPEQIVIPPSLRCAVLIHRLEDGYTGRANTIGTYMELNRQFLVDGVYNPKGPVPEGVDVKAQISSDSIIGDSSRIGERTSIKKSVIGRHCIIGKNVKITNSVIMDHVSIADGAKIDNSILSKHTHIGGKAQLKDCESAAGSQVQDEETHSGETIEAEMEME